MPHPNPENPAAAQRLGSTSHQYQCRGKRPVSNRRQPPGMAHLNRSANNFMADNLPYLATPGTAPRALEKIKAAATPERFTTDFVNTVLGFKGGTGAALSPFFKRLGFVASDGTPTELYKRFRNPSSTKQAAAEAFKTGYRALYERNEYIHKATDEDLKGAIVEVTGREADSQVVSLVFSTIKALKPFCDFDAKGSSPTKDAGKPDDQSSGKEKVPPHEKGGMGLNLAYSINLHLPASDDIKVFDAIFKSLKENLLRD